MTTPPQPIPFEETDAGRLLMNSVQYLAMANLVSETDEYRTHPRKFNRPILNILAIGIELFLKYIHILGGKSVDEVANGYRHNFWKLWQECPDQRVRAMILQVAEETYGHAVIQKLAPPTEDLSGDFLAAMHNLSKLHTAGGSQLRYLAPPNVKATAPGWLIQTFFQVSDACLRRPPLG